jgi:hypothetical protein
MDTETMKVLEALSKGPKPSGDIKPMTFTSYARQVTIVDAGGWLYGGWSNSFTGACPLAGGWQIAKGAVISLRNAGTCPGGDVVIECVHN